MIRRWWLAQFLLLCLAAGVAVLGPGGLAGRGQAAIDTVAIALQPDGPGYVVGLDENGNAVRNLSPDPGNYGPPRWSPDGSMLAYPEDIGDGTAALVIARADGSLVARVAEPSSLDGAISWAPNSDAVVYAANYDPTLGGLYHILTYTIDSATRIDLTSQIGVGGSKPDWSSRNKIGFYCGRDSSGVYPQFCFVNPDALGLAKTPAGLAPWSGPVWSPDGAYVAYSSSCGVPCGWVAVNSTTTPVEQVAFSFLHDSTYTYSSVAWSPDRTKLLTADQFSPKVGTSLFSFDGGSLVPLIRNDPSSGVSGSLYPSISSQPWSPDNDTVAIRGSTGTYLRDAATLSVVAGPLPGLLAAWRPVVSSPPTLTPTPTPTPPPPPPNVVYISIGDSVSTGCSVANNRDGANGPKDCTAPVGTTKYPLLVLAKLEEVEPDAQFCSLNKWGWTADKVIDELLAAHGIQAFCAAQGATIDADSRVYVTVTIGANDYEFGEVFHWLLHGTQAHLGLHETDLQTDLRSLFTLLSVLPNAKTFITTYHNPYISDLPERCVFRFCISRCGPILTGAEVLLWGSKFEPLRSRLAGLNDVIEAEAATANAAVVDLYTPFIGHGTMSSDPWVYGTDCRLFRLLTGNRAVRADPHPNAAGQREIADLIWDQMH